MTPTEVVLAFATAVFVNFDSDAARELVAPDFIQHNPAVPTGAELILGFTPALKDSGITADVHRIIAEDDMIVIHGTYDNAQLFGGETLVAFDVFRVDDGRIVEH